MVLREFADWFWWGGRGEGGRGLGEGTPEDEEFLF